MKSIVLVTGASGFVGKQIVKSLKKQGVSVRFVLRSNSVKAKSAPEEFEKVVYTQDLFKETSDWWCEVCKGVDTVIHAAWYAEPGKYLNSTLNLECLKGTLELAKGACEAGVRRFIGIGTCFEYDLTEGWLSVNTALKPTTPYGAAKAAAFIALNQLLPLFGLEFAWCRLFYLYGEGEHPKRLFPYLRRQLAAGEHVNLTDGEQIRDYLDVCEAGKLIAGIALSGEQGPVNICSGVPVTVRAIAEQIADEYQGRALLKFGTLPKSPSDPPCVVGIANRKKHHVTNQI